MLVMISKSNEEQDEKHEVIVNFDRDPITL
jgi:hypothetical protein